jgi:NAD+ kinase
LKKLTTNNKRIGLVANPEKVICRRLIRQTAARIRAAGREVLADAVTANLGGLKGPVCDDVARLAREVDLLMVFGGDGTMLRIAREIAGSKTPMLGINVGGLGFLTDVQTHELPRALEEVWAGETLLESRPLIEASGEARGNKISCIALNDFVITRGSLPRLIELELVVDDEVVTRYRGDGVIVCSPTGSTAYSLAAGGAIVNPSASVFTLTPICPHTLSNRSIIVSLSSVVQVKVLSHRVESVLTTDGQSPIALGVGDCITIRKSRHSVQLLHLAGSSFFSTLRRKLNWVGSHV